MFSCVKQDDDINACADDPSKGLLLLDTEGLNDPKKGSRAHDAQLFTLAVLLSSVLVYNSKGKVFREWF